MLKSILSSIVSDFKDLKDLPTEEAYYTLTQGMTISLVMIKLFELQREYANVYSKLYSIELVDKKSEELDKENEKLLSMLLSKEYLSELDKNNMIQQMRIEEEKNVNEYNLSLIKDKLYILAYISENFKMLKNKNQYANIEDVSIDKVKEEVDNTLGIIEEEMRKKVDSAVGSLLI